MLPDIRYGYSGVWIRVQDKLDKISASFGNEARKEIVAGENLLVEFACIRVFKGEVTASHGVENNSARPDVSVQAVVSLASYHLRSRVARRTTSSFEELSLLVSVGEAKVNDLNVVILVKQKVLWLQVSVADSHLVNVFHARENLLKEFARLVLLQPFVLDNVVEQFSSLREFHYQEKLSGGFDNLM